jgi:rare lipoprotein A
MLTKILAILTFFHHPHVPHGNLHLYTAGVASWYGPGFQGSPTASGIPFDTNSPQCAMLHVKLGTVVIIENVKNHRRVPCVISDRGPYVGDRVLDMSHYVKDMLAAGDLTQVKVWVGSDV